jgi:ATP-dependent helicase YprA (DUF1998 family)
MSNAKTIAETITEIRSALQDYIEATYHVGDPTLVGQRRDVLEAEGALFRAPYIESTPRYTTDRPFASLDLPNSARDLLVAMAHPPEPQKPLIFDPPYSHQARALEAAIGREKSLVVTTGTGSGKTETFLLPVLSKLAIEASDDKGSFSRSAVRAILLYPMNALVNDQLGRLRLMFGDPIVREFYSSRGGRPARFARYTSRTLYPGVRTSKKDSTRLRAIERFYVSILQKAAESPPSPEQERAARLLTELRSRGKWPSKPDLAAWYGKSGQHWQDKHGEFVRAVMRPEDPELFTRHEVLANAPDILVTNYSMLEYMLMRPLERPVFQQTREWLQSFPAQRLLLIVDEAHLYRGAAGAEVGLLLRRLRARLGISAERIQVICTSASFNDQEYARVFAAQLVGKATTDFETVQGDLALRDGEAAASADDAAALAAVALDRFYDATDDNSRDEAVADFLRYRGVQAGQPLERALYEALRGYAPMSLLVNLTMREARPLQELAREIFPGDDPELADRALTVLVALGSVAREAEGEPGLLPCRVHAFFRGLPGLWACADPDCCALPNGSVRGPVGSLYAQPQDSCACGARVFELFTCRHCGSAYLRAYTDNLERPTFLWAEEGGGLESAAGRVKELFALDVLLEEPTSVEEPAELDLVTGRLNPMNLGDRMRQVFIKGERVRRTTDDDDDDDDDEASGEFIPCGVCGDRAAYGRSSVQDHQTKGDQPFQALVTRQLQVQPPGRQPYSDFAPLRGRKVLIFSDSRQTAARLAPNLQTYSMQDVVRPLILRGWTALQAITMLSPSLSLEDLYLSVLVGARLLSVRLRPQVKGTESLHVMREVALALDRNALENPAELLQLLTVRSEPPPESLLRTMVAMITDRFYGLESLALASLRERRNLEDQLAQLPSIPGVADTEDERLALVRGWLSSWTAPTAGIWFQNMNPSFWQTRRGVRPHSGNFASFKKWFTNPAAKKAFDRDWLPVLLQIFCEPVAPNKFRIRASNLSLQLEGSWGYCQACRTTQRPFPNSTKCINCGRERVVQIDPATDEVFIARKGYYRASAQRALAEPPDTPMAIIAAEHTAQLNAAQSDEVFSKAEEHELLFQDVNLGLPGPGEQPMAAIDVLSCTTTMEVGIDIGALSGVALRNMPPSRANYQQRAGRAGRRGNAIATVVAFGSADSHDEHYFSEPDAMIRGRVDDPILTLDNAEIARRHITAFLLQRYLEDRLPDIDPEDQPQLFEVLGTVAAFVRTDSTLNRDDLEVWLRENEHELVADADDWLPTEIDERDRQELLESVVSGTLAAVDLAITDVRAELDNPPEEGANEQAERVAEDDAEVVEGAAEEGEEHANPHRASENLLDRLLYRGVLPRYAFPTDVVSFYVFDRTRSTRFRAEFLYAPSQGLPIALSQYAPGKRVWIDGKEWRSGALYAPVRADLYSAWHDRMLYFECSTCHYARTFAYGEADRGEVRGCPACGGEATFGSAKNWIRPPGFAHPQSWEEETSPDDQPAKSYATRAKLVAPGPADVERWVEVTPRIREHYSRTHLLVTNAGPRGEGYTYCTRCGLIEPTAVPTSTISGAHPKPYPDDREPTCEGGASTRGLVLGTDFISDVLLLGLRVDAPLLLRPGVAATDVVLRTLAEAVTIAATNRLEIERHELQAEYRPALNAGGHQGLEAEIYLYDTLAGGAGFARRVGDLGIEILEEAIRLLESCPAACDRSCYRCLRSFRNRFEHELLDRHLGASLLRYLVRGEEPVLSKDRLEHAADLLYADVSRLGLEGIEFERNGRVELPGIGTVEAPILARSSRGETIIGVHGPLTPDYAADERLRDAKEYGTRVPVQLIDEIVIARNLPRASQEVIEAAR